MPHLTATRHLVSPPPGPPPEIPYLVRYHQDLVRPFGAEVDPARWSAGPQVGFPQLVDHLLAAADGEKLDPDLIVLAYALPDLHPFVTTASYLNHRLGNRARSFAVSEQGLLAPFTALRIAAAHQRGGRGTRALIAVLEQTSLPVYDPLAHDSGLVDSAVLLAVDAEGDGHPRVLRSGTEGQHLGGLGAVLAEAPAGARLLVTGARTEVPETPGVDVHRARPDTYCTGVWLELSRRLPEWRERYDTLVLHDADPRSGARATAVLDLTGTGGPA
ncbi:MULTISPECIES: hypothetical protein [Streptomyces]|uniref:Uncharacterized protein n=1 Tax=Streptomyces albus (strain ATCC 21838 / DSM 41398 / FERM P-419 / JCM 4703 / NBRC 107858) TaxID=1081613 RepID=A0A0B5ET13_STRA4|nr:hypothetical protein [Streptomyces sp. SCSIO ZS0520]AJE85963.1 hypothetical protein SLNWT_5587 [Streptomyces albus]AOU80265.1 hypothetical protein SLNHY_5574 [Streptomyces albus]AYN35980.1 hypothetical protein DUI70_5485 [Streptomyces albus]